MLTTEQKLQLHQSMPGNVLGGMILGGTLWSWAGCFFGLMAGIAVSIWTMKSK